MEYNTLKIESIAGGDAPPPRTPRALITRLPTLEYGSSVRGSSRFR